MTTNSQRIASLETSVVEATQLAHGLKSSVSVTADLLGYVVELVQAQTETIEQMARQVLYLSNLVGAAERPINYLPH